MRIPPARFPRLSGLRIAALFGLALALALASAPAAHAATITVTTTADSLAADGECSLREAIRAANAQASVDACLGVGSDRISLPAGTYALAIGGPGEDAAASGDLDITRALTIEGAGAAAAIVDGAKLDRVFDIRAGTVTLVGLTIQHGQAETGGGVRNAGTLYLKHAVVRQNLADSFSGGGVLNLGTMYVESSSVSDNVAAEEGGGFDNQGTLQLVGSQVTGNDNVDGSGGGFDNRGTLILHSTRVAGNTSDGDGGIRNLRGGVVRMTGSVVADNDSTANAEFGQAGGIGNGGALEITGSTISGNRGAQAGGVSNAGFLTLTSSTISGNSSLSDAGGLLNWATLTMTNSTISGNLADGAGGGLVSGDASARASLLNVTIAQNVSDDDGAGGEQGGGVVALAGTVGMTNTVIAGNSVAGAQASNCVGTLTSFGHNAIAGANGCTLAGSGAGDLLGGNPALGPLQNNGGATLTHALLNGSPLIDAGDTAACPAADQRGAARPADGDRDGAARCDIGAFEAGGSALFLPLVRR